VSNLFCFLAQRKAKMAERACKNCPEVVPLGSKFYGCCSEACQLAHRAAGRSGSARQIEVDGVADNAAAGAAGKSRYFSITCGFGKCDTAPGFFDDYYAFVKAKCTKGFQGIERGKRDRLLHGQSWILHYGPSDVKKHAALVRKEIRAETHCAANSGLKIICKVFASNQSEERMTVGRLLPSPVRTSRCAAPLTSSAITTPSPRVIASRTRTKTISRATHGMWTRP
jgi:hypothetical protein